ncbi:DUF2625 family protein [Dactylosporangium vinaceum]|nr:DUF2625 family protein [Dactylosporangium vinaceum]
MSELVDAVDPAWPEVEAAAAAAPYQVVVLAADPRRADEELQLLQVTTRSWLGAVVHSSGGLVLDHGWLRVFGSEHDERRLASLSQVNDHVAGAMIVAQDVLGGHRVGSSSQRAAGRWQTPRLPVLPSPVSYVVGARSASSRSTWSRSRQRSKSPAISSKVAALTVLLSNHIAARRPDSAPSSLLRPRPVR